MNSARRLVVSTILLVLNSVSLLAESLPPGSAQITYVEGKVYLNDQRVESAPMWILNPNAVVRTEDGRAEVHLAGDVSLFVGENTAVKRVPSSPFSFSRFELLSGSTVVITGDFGAVATCENEVTLSIFGLYRFDAFPIPGQPAGKKVCGLAVHEGAAAVQLPSMISVVTPGRFVSLNLDCGDRMVLQKVNTERTDSLDHWSRQRTQFPDKLN